VTVADFGFLAVTIGTVGGLEPCLFTLDECEEILDVVHELGDVEPITLALSVALEVHTDDGVALLVEVDCYVFVSADVLLETVDNEDETLAKRKDETGRL